tara:strand:+ start:5449 stop:6642 length:1194 start_codon:yes stop_codon:yes gene_type:complete
MEKLVILSSSNWRKSIAITRQLGRLNYKIILCRRSFLDMACWSKYCFKSHKVSDKTYLEDLINIGKIYYKKYKKKPILIFCEDLDLKLIFKSRSLLKKYFLFLLPENKSLMCGLDKLYLYESLVKNEKFKELLPFTISTSEFTSSNKFSSLIINSPNNKWVLKPKSSSGSIGIKYCYENKLVSSISKLVNPKNYLIQEFIEKESVTFCATIVFNKSSKLCSYLLHKRIYEYPTSGGPSTQRESVYNHKVINYSIEILKFLKWKGIAMLEWKYVLDQDKYYLIEINPRPGGSIVLDELANSQILINYCKSLKENKLKTQFDPYYPSYKLNIKSTWMIPGDFLRFISMRNKERESLKDFLKAQYFCEEFALDDIKGFIGIIICQIILLFKPSNWKYLSR